MKRVLICTGLLMIASFTAFAGKQERDFMTKTVEPALAKAQDTYQTSCGCPLAIVLDRSIATLDDMSVARYIAEEISSNIPTYCSDAASKRAVCAMKTLSIAHSKETKFTYRPGAGLALTDGHSHSTWKQMSREIDK